jgi:hypothetical protein
MARAIGKAQQEIEKGIERYFDRKLGEGVSRVSDTFGLPACFGGIDGTKTIDEFRGDLISSITSLTNGNYLLDTLPDIVRSISDCIDDSDPDATPGIPLNFYGNKKGSWCEDQVSLVLLVLDRLLIMINFNDTYSTGVDFVKAGLCDPIYTFIKDEPHKREKLDKNRFRIISGVSLVDNIIERLLFSKQNKSEIAMHEFIPFKPGMGLHDEGQSSLYSWFKGLEKDFELCSTDVSGWDWSVTDYLLDADLAYRKRFTGGCESWYQLAKTRFECLKYKVFQLPSGEMYTQNIPGIQASGSYLTSSSNSHMRYILSILVQLELGVDEECNAEGCQMGDDALERYLEGLLEMYRLFGFTVKGVEIMPPGVFSFCSTLWENSDKGFPESWAKTLFRFLHKNPSDPLYLTYREQFRRDLRNHPDIDSLLERVDDFRSIYS